MKEVKVLVTPSGLTLQARILEWIAIPFFGDLPDPGIGPRSPMLQADSLPSAPPGMLNREVSFTKCFLLPSSVTSQITFSTASLQTHSFTCRMSNRRTQDFSSSCRSGGLRNKCSISNYYQFHFPYINSFPSTYHFP